MRQYSRSTSKSTSANRIRERYLHQLGLQRGNGFVGAGMGSGMGGVGGHHHHRGDQQVVVISGLPSLPEERATTELVLPPTDQEIHHSQQQQQLLSQPEGGDHYHDHNHHQDVNGMQQTGGEQDVNESKPARHGFHVNDNSSITDTISIGGGGSIGSTISHISHDSTSPLCTSANNTNNNANNNTGAPSPAPISSITSLALSYPKALLKAPPMGVMPSRSTSFHGGSSSSSGNNNNGNAKQSNLSKTAASLLLQDNPTGAPADHDSVSSTATSTTAESSFSAMVSRDWSVINNNSTNANAPQDAVLQQHQQQQLPQAQQPQRHQQQGVYYHRGGHTRLITPNSLSNPLLVGQQNSHPSVGHGSLNSYHHQSSTAATTHHQQHHHQQQQHYFSSSNSYCGATSSITNALNRFNIDSDCEASVASRCGNSIMTEDDYHHDYNDDQHGHSMMTMEDEEDGMLSCDDGSRCSSASNAILSSSVGSGNNAQGPLLSSSVGSANNNNLSSNNANVLSSSIGSTATNFTQATNASANTHNTANTNASNTSKLSSRKKKIGKAQRLMDRAAAHERILQIRNDQSTMSRKNLVQSQRGMSSMNSSSSSVSPAEGVANNNNTGAVRITGVGAVVSGVKTEELASSYGSCSTKGSIPLLHVQHGATSTAPAPSPAGGASAAPAHLNRPSSSMISCSNDPLGKTPTSSNCTDFRKLTQSMELDIGTITKNGVPNGPPPSYLNSMLYPGLNTTPVGVHISSNTCRDGPLPLPRNNIVGIYATNSSENGNLEGVRRTHSQSIDSTNDNESAASQPQGTAARPLQFHPQLASRIPTPPPKLAFSNNNNTASNNINNSLMGMQAAKPEIVSSSAMHPATHAPGVHVNHAANHTGMHGISMNNTRSATYDSGNGAGEMEFTDRQVSVDDVLEVAMTLSKLGGRGTPGNTIPRLR